MYQNTTLILPKIDVVSTIQYHFFHKQCYFFLFLLFSTISHRFWGESMSYDNDSFNIDWKSMLNVHKNWCRCCIVFTTSIIPHRFWGESLLYGGFQHQFSLLMLKTILLTMVVSTSDANRCWMFLKIDVKIIFSCSVKTEGVKLIKAPMYGSNPLSRDK